MKDFYYRISKDEMETRRHTSKLSAAQLREKITAMKIRREEMKKKNQLEREAIKAKEKMLEDRRKKASKAKQMNLAHAIQKNGENEGINSVKGGIYTQSPSNKLSYRAQKNKEKGLPEEEGLNTKVTLDLLQKLHYKDIQQSMPDDFKPEKYVTDVDDDEEDDSVFDYFFPGNKKKKPKKNAKGNNYSEKIMNIKREFGDTKSKRQGQDVIFEEQESMYKSDKESRRTKTNRSIQPSNPGQSKKSHRRVESQIALHSKANKDLTNNQKGNITARGPKTKNLNSLKGVSKKYVSGGQTSRKAGSNKRLLKGANKSKDKLHKSNQKSHIMGKIAKIEDMRKKQERDNLERAMKTHNNQLRRSQKYLK